MIGSSIFTKAEPFCIYIYSLDNWSTIFPRPYPKLRIHASCFLLCILWAKRIKWTHNGKRPSIHQSVSTTKQMDFNEIWYWKSKLKSANSTLIRTGLRASNLCLHEAQIELVTFLRNSGEANRLMANKWPQLTASTGLMEVCSFHVNQSNAIFRPYTM